MCGFDPRFQVQITCEHSMLHSHRERAEVVYMGRMLWSFWGRKGKKKKKKVPHSTIGWNEPIQLHHMYILIYGIE